MTEQDDIYEHLPLELEGLAVRETIREVFSNPAHGTPDKISKEGCLALARMSKQVGRAKGYVLWNAWRKAFPVVEKSFRQYSNHADFAEHDFRESGINFSRFVFGDRADFSGAQWGDGADFRGARWGDNANFRGAHWGWWANFRGAHWGDNANFRGAQWGDGADFSGAQWGLGADFRGAQWGNNADFSGAQWGLGADFSGAQWGDRANFSGAQWEALREAFPDEEAWQDAQERAKRKGLAPDEFQSIYFSGATFLGRVDFSNRRFKGVTRFSALPNDFQRKIFKRDEQGKAELDDDRDVNDPNQRRELTFHEAPLFHGCELHQDTSFEGAKFPEPAGSEEAARAYRTLKLAFSKQQAIREEQRFFRLEMEEETLREKGIKHFLFKAYKRFSDYGFSITRPLKYLWWAVFWLTLVYGLLSGLGHCVLAVGTCSFEPQWLEFSLLQTLPLPGLDKLSEAAAKAFWPEGGWWSLLLSTLVIAHKTISLAALFLVGLALRNLFKLK